MANERDEREEYQSVNDYRNTLVYQFKKAGLLGSGSKASEVDSALQIDGTAEVDGTQVDDTQVGWNTGGLCYTVDFAADHKEFIKPLFLTK
ncbi:hypothetical protein ACHAP5_004590 [Fusarium lateritium]